MQDIFVSYDCEYSGIVRELRTYNRVHTRSVGPNVSLIVILQSKPDRLLQDVTRHARSGKTLVASTLLDVWTMEEIYRVVDRAECRFFFLDYKSLDTSNVSMLRHNTVPWQVNVKTQFFDAPPIHHEVFQNLLLLRTLLGSDNFNSQINSRPHMSECTRVACTFSMRTAAGTVACVYTSHGIRPVDTVQLDESVLELPENETRITYSERYGSAIQTFVMHHHKLDARFHRIPVRDVLSKLRNLH